MNNEISIKDPRDGATYHFVHHISQAMGDAMNRAFKLDENIDRGFETLITELVFDASKERTDCRFLGRTPEEIPFPFYEALKDKE